MHDDVIVVGAWRKDSDNNRNNGARAGAAYIFVLDEFGWEEVQKFTGPENGSNFGVAVAVSGDTIAVGAPDATTSTVEVDGQSSSNGLVRVYVRSGVAEWTLQQTLIEPTPGVMNLFGDGLSLDGDNLLIGAPGVGYFVDYAFMNDRAYGC